MKKIILSVSRRGIQLTVIFFLIVLPLNSLEVSIRSQVGSDIGNFDSNCLSRLYHSAVENGWISEEKLAGIKGSLWSLDIKGYRISEPLAVVEAFASAVKLPAIFLFSAIPFLLLTLLMGRVFCSWLCPANLIFEIVQMLRVFFERIGVKFKKITFSYDLKYYLLAFGIVFSFFAGVPFFSVFYPPLLLSNEVFLYVYSLPVTGLTIILGIIIFEFFISPRSWCRYFCPGGALYSFLGKYRLIGVSADKNLCTQKEGCTVCLDSCGMGFYPPAKNHVGECDNCGKCIIDCPKDALNFKRKFRQ